MRLARESAKLLNSIGPSSLLQQTLPHPCPCQLLAAPEFGREGKHRQEPAHTPKGHWVHESRRTAALGSQGGLHGGGGTGWLEAEAGSDRAQGVQLSGQLSCL